MIFSRMLKDDLQVCKSKQEISNRSWEGWNCIAFRILMFMNPESVVEGPNGLQIQQVSTIHKVAL